MIGQFAYDAYCAEVGGKHPAYDKLSKKEAAAWEAAAQAVLTATFGRNDDASS